MQATEATLGVKALTGKPEAPASALNSPRAHRVQEAEAVAPAAAL
jgi:hypothetical protein